MERLAAAELRIELQRAVDHRKRQRRAEAVAVDDDLIGIGLTEKPHQFAGETIEPRLELRPRAMHEVARKIPVVERVADMHRSSERPSQAGEDREPKERREQHGIRQFSVDHGKTCRRDRQPSHP